MVWIAEGELQILAAVFITQSEWEDSGVLESSGVAGVNLQVGPSIIVAIGAAAAA